MAIGLQGATATKGFFSGCESHTVPIWSKPLYYSAMVELEGRGRRHSTRMNPDLCTWILQGQAFHAGVPAMLTPDPAWDEPGLVTRMATAFSSHRTRHSAVSSAHCSHVPPVMMAGSHWGGGSAALATLRAP